MSSAQNNAVISEEGVKRYCNAMYAAKAVYIWGADGEIITKKVLDGLKERFGTGNYKNISIDNIEGCIGCDCSGFLTPLSGKNMTAANYYKKCLEKGKAENLPKNKVCLLFRKEDGEIVHVAVYTGDGRLTEMWNGCEQRKFKQEQWSFYGIPDWIAQTEKALVSGDKITLSASVPGYYTAADAAAGKNKRVTVVPGEYYVYKVYGKALNVSKKKSSAGSWIVIN